MTDAGLATVCGLAGLRWLSMAGSDGVRSPGFQGLCRLAALEFLCVQKCHGFDDDALAALRSLTELKALQLGWCVQLTPKGLYLLQDMPQLTELDLTATKLDDAGLARMGGALQALKILSLRSTAISQHGLQHCRRMVRMRRLDLNGCDVSSGAVRLPALDTALVLDTTLALALAALLVRCATCSRCAS